MIFGEVVGYHEKNSHQMLYFWVDPCLKYGSLNFDLNALTDMGQSIISQLLWDVDRRYIYAKLKVFERAFWANDQESSETIMKGSKITFTPFDFANSKFDF